MEHRPLRSVVKDTLEIGGGLVEENGDRLEAIMPEGTAAKLGLKEHEVLYFSPEASGEGEFISYGSEMLDQISQLVEDKGLYSKAYLPPLYLKKESPQAIIDQNLSLSNFICRRAWAEERPVSYLIFNFRYSAMSQEKKEGIVPAVVNELTLASPRRMTDVLKGAYEEEHRDREAVDRRSLDEVFQVACANAEAEIRSDLSQFERSLNRRLHKDVARLEEYYRTLKEEVEARIRKRELVGEEQEKELSKIRAIDAELNRKIEEQRDRYSIKVNAEPLNVFRITIPALVITMRMRRKKRERDGELVWNPLLKELELPTCEGCLKPISTLYLCDNQLHLTCHGCHECPSCHKGVCHVCYPEACPKCGVSF